MCNIEQFCVLDVNTSHIVPVLLSIVMAEGWYPHTAPLRHDQLLGSWWVINRRFSNFVVCKSGLVSKSIWCHSRVSINILSCVRSKLK